MLRDVGSNVKNKLNVAVQISLKLDKHFVIKTDQLLDEQVLMFLFVSYFHS